MKRITFAAKPSDAAVERPSPDQWVSDREAAGPTKRLTIDVPLALHRRFKLQCVADGTRMADVIRELIERRLDPSASGDGLKAGSSQRQA